jgi:pyridoxamine 5'-phosphate oxidase
VDERFAGEEVTRPPDWGGYRLRADRIEFWHGYENRLHDRILHVREGSGWRVERLSP